MNSGTEWVVVLKNRQDGGSGAEEEADLLEVHLPRSGPGPAAEYVL